MGKKANAASGKADPTFADPPEDYDMRGYWKGIQDRDTVAKQGYDPNHKDMHFPDKWKTPYSQSFSNESRYAKPDAPHWQGNKLVDKHGKVIFDDTKDFEF